jgi:hypothetical protein
MNNADNLDNVLQRLKTQRISLPGGGMRSLADLVVLGAEVAEQRHVHKDDAPIQSPPIDLPAVTYG